MPFHHHWRALLSAKTLHKHKAPVSKINTFFFFYIKNMIMLLFFLKKYSNNNVSNLTDFHHKRARLFPFSKKKITPHVFTLFYVIIMSNALKSVVI